jgi:hypothetical protein
LRSSPADYRNAAGHWGTAFYLVVAQILSALEDLNNPILEPVGNQGYRFDIETNGSDFHIKGNGREILDMLIDGYVQPFGDQSDIREDVVEIRNQIEAYLVLLYGTDDPTIRKKFKADDFRPVFATPARRVDRR